MNRLKERWYVLVGIALAFGLVAMCLLCSIGPFVAFTGSAVSTQVPMIQVTGSIPTPIPTPPQEVAREGETWAADNLAMTVVEHKLEGCFDTELGSQRCPPEGATYLWVRVLRENRGSSTDLPIYSCLWTWLLYQGEELHPIWIVHPKREDWSGGGCNKLYSGYQDEGWVCFEVPSGIDPSKVYLRIESYQGPEFKQVWGLSR